jgi:cbb3-type cytochrome oxidase subunit 1
MRLTWGGVLVYAGIAVVLLVQTVRLILMDRLWADGIAFAPVCLVAVVAATALLFLVAVVTRQPLIEGDGPWFITMGWAVVIVLTVLGLVISTMSSLDQDAGLWVTGPAVFVPFWVRKLEESYREGVEEGRRERS